MDVMSPGKRSALMSRIRSKDTKPERLVRQLAHKLGFRFRLHRRDLPGVPDLVFPVPKEGDLCTWLFLASTPPLPVRLQAQVEPEVLGEQAVNKPKARRPCDPETA